MVSQRVTFIYYSIPHHRWKLPLFRYHEFRLNHPYPFLGVILRIILHDFIRQNYHRKLSNRYPFFLIMVN